MEKEPVSDLPHSEEMERVVLGMMLSDINALDEGMASMDSSDFFQAQHTYIFKALASMHHEDRCATSQLLIEELKRTGRLEGVGGICYIKVLEEYRECRDSFEGAVEVVKSKSILRKLAKESLSLYRKAVEDRDDARGLLDSFQARLYAIGSGMAKENWVTVKGWLAGDGSNPKKSIMENITERQATFREKGPSAVKTETVKTHLYEIDNILLGLGKRQLIILAARTAVGKTSMALNIAENVAIIGGLPVGIFSLEMGADELGHRILCSNARVNSARIKTGDLSGVEYQQVNSAAHRLGETCIIIDDQPAIKINELANRARRMKECYNISLLIVDYLQLIRGSGARRSEENRQTEVAELSRALKALAGELDIPILCLAQLSRKVEERESKKPILSDLRESGALEQDADVVLLLTRKDAYDPYDKPGLAQVQIAKNRHGRTGDVELIFSKEYAKFENYTKDEAPQSDPFVSMKR